MNLSRIDLNLVVTLQVLLQEKNVTHAARRLRLSQPAVSASLARLREQFNDPLLVRVGRHYELTPLAERLQLEVETAVSGLENLFDTREAEEIFEQKKTFRIAARDYMTMMLLPDLMNRLSAGAPNFSVLFSRVDADSFARLAEGELDFIIIPELSNHSFPSRLLFRDQWLCVGDQNNQALGDSLTEAQYLSFQHIIFLPGPGKRIATSPQVSEIAARRKASVAVDDFAMIPQLLGGTELIATIPSRLARLLAGRMSLKVVPPPHEIPPLVHHVCWNPRMSHDLAHQWLLDQIVAAGETLTD